MSARGRGLLACSLVLSVLAGAVLPPARPAAAAPPSISSFDPTSGPIGTSITISGQNFVGVTAVKFNGVSQPFFAVNSTSQITTAIPPGATSGPISVTTAEGTATSAASFTVLPDPPTIAGFFPSSGAPGLTVTITGNHFTDITFVKFNGVDSTSFTVDSATQIRARVPNGATTGKISVVGANGMVQSDGTFTVLEPTTITSFSPTSGPPNQPVRIFGTNFVGVTNVRFNNNDAFFAVTSTTEINTAVPQGATTGPIRVTTAAGTAVSGTNFTVTKLKAPTITGFTPTSGPRGTEVTITGESFITTTVVEFDGANAQFTVDSDTQVRATVPDDGTSGRIRLGNTEGDTESDDEFTVSETPSTAPEIDSFSPSRGTVGTSVTINGRNFTGATRVDFNGRSAVFSVDSDTRITATVPANATSGRIRVVNPDGDTESRGKFTVDPTTPVIKSFKPSKGPVGTTVKITGQRLTGATLVQFNGVPAAFTVNSSTQITATVPAGATTGKIRVTTPFGTATSSAKFTVRAA